MPSAPVSNKPSQVPSGEGKVPAVLDSKSSVAGNLTKDFSLTEEQAMRLNHLLGLNISTPEELLHQSEKFSTIRTEGVEVVFEPRILQRLKTRCPRNVSFDQFLKKEVVRWAADYCGC